MKWSIGVSALSLILFAQGAYAQEGTAGAASASTTAPSASSGPADSGLSFGLRTGYALPLGNAAEFSTPLGKLESKLSDVYSGAIPIWADVGYRINPNIYVGGFFQFGVGLMNSDKGADSGNVMKFGANAHYHFMPQSNFDPWAGLGVGYEIANAKNKAGAETTMSGFEFANLQAGGDFKVMPALRVGPTAMFSVGQYSSISSGGTSLSGFDKTMHMWLTLGIRGQYDL